MAIAGDGYFVVRDAVTNSPFVTRAGDFRVDTAGYLITSGGQRVQGFSDAALTTIGDIQIDLTGKPDTADPEATLQDWAINTEGKINVRLSDGTQFVRGQVLLQVFRDPQALLKEGNSLYSGIAAAGPLGGAENPTPVPPGTSGTGEITSGALELSNVSSMITAQRAFQATARIISTSDEMLQELVNLKR
jgi:flagellar hook protein FlgE